MGFRDLRLFNKAILAKQAWRIHTHPTSLAARVLQGFYFHRSSFLQVKVNSSSSFVWRSILWGRELYTQGLRCKIGLPLPRRATSDSLIWHYHKSVFIYSPHSFFLFGLFCDLFVKDRFFGFSYLLTSLKMYKLFEKLKGCQFFLTSPGNGEILIDNKQHYKFLGKNIDVISLIKLDVVEGKKFHHEDWWDKKPLWNRDTIKLPLVGRMIEITRRGSMLATHAMMRF
ncbi:hypothetical protein UlMin_037497, partial [Ulmus minor]